MSVALGIDVGTTSAKVAAIDGSGKRLGLDVTEYDLIQPAAGFAEVDPEVYWEGLPAAIAKVLGEGGLEAGDVKAIAVSSQGQTFVCLDDRQRPLDNAMTWLDTRAQEEAKEVEGVFGAEAFYRRTGCPIVTPSWTMSMIEWIRKHKPDVFAKAKRFALICDYVAIRATGKAVIAETLAVSSGLYDLEERRWWPELIELLQIGEDRLSRVAPSGRVIGGLTREAAEFLGLAADTPLVTGAWDQVAAAVGSGNLGPGQLAETTGTALAVAAATEGIVFDPKRRLLTIPHAVEGRGILLPFAATSGIVLKWFRETLCDVSLSYDELTGLAATSPAGANGVIFIPHFEGTASPSFDQRVTGAICGLRLHHGRADIVRGLLESLAFMLRELVEIVEDLGVSPETIVSLGGGARSELLCRIKADTLGIPVRTLASGEAALQGDAMLALVGIGEIDDLEQAAERMVHPGATFEPDAEGRRVYEEVYERYQRTFRGLYPDVDTR